VREVVATGVTFIDTADVYGPHSNEELNREATSPSASAPRCGTSPSRPASSSHGTAVSAPVRRFT
jgi:aldo/keto reductase family protein